MVAVAAMALGQAGAGQSAPPDSAAGNGLVMEPAELPGTYPQAPYQVVLDARGNYVPVLHWSVVDGALPPGIVLEDNGTLHGGAQRAGEFRFVVAVRDGS